MTAPEFSRLCRLDTIGPSAVTVTVGADAAERAGIAARFDLAVLDRLEADFTLRREGALVRAEGRLRASATQSCVTTGEPVPATIDAPFVLRFEPEPAAADEEIELAADDCDTIFYAGGAIDLGEAAAETLVLLLDPYPRSASADAVAREAGLLDAPSAGPFGALAALKGKLGGGD